jgi:uncharacterized protein YecE (DUF72 family)
MRIGKKNIYIGTSGWSYPHWKGNFYPDNLAKSNWFEYYLQNFDTVEVNATFYRRFKDETYEKWKKRVPKEFRYVLKVPRLITHRKLLHEVDDLVDEFQHSARILRDNLGLLLLQLPPRISYHPERLDQVLRHFKHPEKVAVEIRNKEWFTEEIYGILKNCGSVFCTADSPKTELMDWVTGDTGYIRLHGRTKWYSYDYSEKELQEIVDFIKKLNGKSVKTFYIFFNNDYQGYAPRNASTLLEMVQRSF